MVPLSFSTMFSRGVALIGGTALRVRQFRDGHHEPAWGSTPSIPAAKPQGNVPTLKMPTAQGWAPGQLPVAAPGLKVNAFAAGLDHPRWF
jgi:glucose/arabinose dehydrogenase